MSALQVHTHEAAMHVLMEYPNLTQHTNAKLRQNIGTL